MADTVDDGERRQGAGRPIKPFGVFGLDIIILRSMDEEQRFLDASQRDNALPAIGDQYLAE